jgi:SAM-dependent methyltransferase
VQIERLQADWDKLGRADPMWAILSDDALRKGGWEARETEFFASGAEEIEVVMAEVALLAPTLPRGVALDFGCGIGRLTRPLAGYFDRVIGVDIAPSMISRARESLPAGVNCEFVVNDKPSLEFLPSESVDFAYTRLVLQHIPVDLSRLYIAEFIRTLRPGGLALFQVPARSVTQSGRWRRRVPPPLKAMWHEVKGRLSLAGKIGAFCIPREDVEAIVRASGGTVVRVQLDLSTPGFESFMYAAAKT